MIAPSALRALAQQAAHDEPPGKARAALAAACDPQTILALLDAVEAAREFVTDDGSGDPTEAFAALVAALAPFTETQT